MLDNDDLIAIDEVLELCGGSRTSIKEENWLNHTGAEITQDCDKYGLAQKVAAHRAKYKIGKSEVLDNIKTLAESNGCSVTTPTVEKPGAIIPIFCGGIDA